jgi:hypothetical protein
VADVNPFSHTERGLLTVCGCRPTARAIWVGVQSRLAAATARRLAIFSAPSAGFLMAYRRIACVTFTVDRIIDAGQLDHDGRRLTDMDTFG